MRKFQKPVAILIILSLVLSINFNLFIFKPKEAQALADVIGGPWQIPATLKDLVLDTIGHTITQVILKVLEQKIMDWGMGRKSDSRTPFAVVDWVQFFEDALTRGAAKFINYEYEQLFDLSDPFQAYLKSNLDFLGFNLYPSDLIYTQYARPTLRDTLTALGINYQNFLDSGYSLSAGGWGSWFAMERPENNIFGQAMMAEQEKLRKMTQEKEAADKQTATAGGYKNEEATKKTDVDACKDNCAAVGPPSPDCLAKCDALPGVAIQTQLKNWGSDINKQMTSALGADMNRLLNVDEITELLGVLYSAIINKAINGLGLAFGLQTSTTPVQRTRADIKTAFSYQRQFKKTQTAEDTKDVRTEVLTNLLKAIQEFDRSITTCDGDEMMKYDDYTQNLADILAPSVESLYIGLEGVNLRPDYMVLDPVFVPPSLMSSYGLVYGYSWGEVPPEKFPYKCQKTLEGAVGAIAGPGGEINASCIDIYSGLEPVNTRCDRCMYDHDALNCPPAPYPPQPYPAGTDPFGNETLLKNKADFFNTCRSVYNTVLDRCEDCLKKVDEKCQQLSAAEQQACIIAQCSNYGEIINNIRRPLALPPAGASDFYNRCLIEEKKDACYTCLKEYFVPATYCEQIKDYTARSIVKYPTLVKKVRNNAPDHEIWLGPYDVQMGEQGDDECDNNDEAESIDLSLICRIIPDYGGNVCESSCSRAGLTGQALQSALKDITDFRPNGKDCGNVKLAIGGKEPWAPINDGVFQVRGKCCADFWRHDKEKFPVCIGGSGTKVQKCSWAVDPWKEPWCYCPEGWRPINFTRTGGAPGGGSFPAGAGKGGDCAGFNFSSANPLLVYTGNNPDGAPAAGWDRYYISNGGNCGEANPINNTDVNDDNVPDAGAITDATAPGGILWSATPGSAQRWCDCSLVGGASGCISASGTGLSAGVYHNNNTDIGSAIHLCTMCLPTDAGYPYYGHVDKDGNPANQCTGKILGAYHYQNCPPSP